MSVSSGTVSLFTTAAFCIALAAGAAYGLKHQDEVRGLVTGLADTVGIKLPEMRAATGGSSDETQSSGVSEDAGPSGDVTLRAAGGGHFEAAAEINGRSVDVMVDTGATLVALTYEDAERAGLYLKPADFTHSVSTANGVAKVAPIEINSISIGSITVRNVRGAVAERGKLHRTLLGMTFLSKLTVEMKKNVLVLRQ
jgi:aspartyl protease family protein